MRNPSWRSCLIRILGVGCILLWTITSVVAIDSEHLKQLFAKPPREFSSAPLWVWNDLLTEEQIAQTLQDLAGQHVKQVFVHPRPGLMTPYLSVDWFRLWRVALAQAEKLDMNIWIYDENSYPSGFAGGLVPEAMPESRGRGLVFHELNAPPVSDSAILTVFRMGGDQPENVTEQLRSGASLPQGHKYLVAAMQRAANSPWNASRCYVDLLYPGVTEKFLDITLGAYQREIGDQFGKRVPGIFTDEPNVIPAGGWPWTDDLPEQFKKRWGYDLLENLCSLRYEVGDWRRVRHNYFSTVNQLFIERWGRPYAERCEKLGLEMTGHYWEHEWPNCRAVPDNMAMYAWPQRPAMDCLMNQYAEHTHAQFGNVRSVRELGSIANQLGKPRTLCEVYGAGGWDLRFEDMKRQADWLAVLGVNTFDQHLSYVTIRGARKRDHPQSFSYHEPWWDAYGLCGRYLERLSVAVSQGAQVNEILVLEPTTTAWMYQGSDTHLKELGDSFFKLLLSLESAQVEYDLGCEDVISRHGSVEGRALKIGRRSYRTVVLPPLTENLDNRTWELLNQYVANGGSVLACKPVPPSSVLLRDGAKTNHEAGVAILNPRWERLDPAEVVKGLRDRTQQSGFRIARTEGDAGTLFHLRRQLEDGELLLLVNTSISAHSSGTVASQRGGVEQWDLESGQIQAYPFRKAKSLEAEFDLPPCGSLVLFFPNTTRPAFAPGSPRFASVSPSGDSQVRALDPNVLVLDYVDITAGGETRTNVYFYQANQFAFQKNGMDRNPWDSAVQFKDELIRKTFPASSGFKATYRFRVEQQLPAGLELVLERPDLYSIHCNGQALQAKPGAWWLDRAFGRIDLSAAARLGENEITIVAEPFTIYHELESAYVRGDFGLRSDAQGFVIVPRGSLGWGEWKAQGYPFYSGGVSYRETFEFEEKSGEAVVTLAAWRGSVAKVLVNGKFAGYIAHAPWRCVVTPFLQKNRNTVEVIVIGTLKNTLGPHHGQPTLGTAWPGMFQKGPANGPPPGLAYDTVGYGLFKPFTLEHQIAD